MSVMVKVPRNVPVNHSKFTFRKRCALCWRSKHLLTADCGVGPKSHCIVCHRDASAFCFMMSALTELLWNSFHSPKRAALWDLADIVYFLSGALGCFF